MSPSSQQARRAAARRSYERYQQRQEQKHRRRQRLQRAGIGVVVLALVAGTAFWGYATFASDDQPTPDALPTPSASPVKGCTPATVTPVADPEQFDAPEQVLGKGPATLTLTTNCGDIVIDLDTKAAPKNANSLAFLAESGYFDGTGCHRLTTGGLFVLQCGDPTFAGTGGPGYTVADENVPADGSYPEGVVAMAEPAGGKAGSQFFLVYADTSLPPDYTVVGQVTQGLAAVKRVAQAGTAGGAPDGEPAQPVVIEQAAVDAG